MQNILNKSPRKVHGHTQVLQFIMTNHFFDQTAEIFDSFSLICINFILSIKPHYNN